MRRGQLYALDTVMDSYGHVHYRLFATVLRPNGDTEKLLVGKQFDTKAELFEELKEALQTEPPANYLHYQTQAYPRKYRCGVGTYAKLCGVDRTDDLEEFLAAENRCLKCWIGIQVDRKGD